MRSFLARNWFFLVLALGLTLALLIPDWLQFLTWLDPRPMVAVALFLMAWGLPSRNLAKELARPWASLWAVAISYGLVPVGAWLIARTAPLPDAGIGLILMACVPCTLGSAMLWTRMAGGNEATAMLALLLSTCTSWLFTNSWLSVLAGATIGIDESMRMMVELLMTLVVPVGIGQACRGSAVLASLADRRRRELGIVSQFLILAIIVKAAARVGGNLQAGSSHLGAGMLIWSVIACTGLHLAALATGLLTSWLFGWDKTRRTAVAFSCSQKTLPVALLLFDGYFQQDFPVAVVPLLFYHVGQLILDTPVARRLAK
ncbi:MAG: hypothetical protein FJ271_18770 [Planctomycetes bacterium]|nr:hypothetical protein [Planctomycetota bacterium]